MALGLHVTLRNNMLDEITARAGGSAVIRIYNDPQPGTSEAITTQTKLAQLTCNSTFAPAATAGKLTLNGISTQTSADNSGTATWFRILAQDLTTIVLDGTVSSTAAATGDLQLDNNVIVGGGSVAISSAEITAGNA